MAGEYDTGTPTQCVSVYEAGRLVAQVMCESAQEAADAAAEWEQRSGVTCEIDDLGVVHDPDDILAFEPEDLVDDDDDDRRVLP
jgi:hypothetical protein